MEKENHFIFRTGVVAYPLAFVLAIWFVYWFEFRMGISFNDFGVRPRTLVGLRGILFSPFIHSDLSHLWHNTLPLLVLSSALFFFYRNKAWQILLIGAFATGVGTWLIGRPANHIGASGVIYLLFGFLFFKGILAKHLRLVALSFMVVFLYGSMIWYVAPVDPKISWEGHLSGLLVGTILAFIIKSGIPKPEPYHWQTPEYNPEDDEFLRHFDENGNFIEKLPEDEIIEDSEEFEVVYLYKEKSREEEE